MTLVLPWLGLAGCTPLAMPDYLGLRAGRQAAAACQERFHDGATDFAECVRYVAGHPDAATSARADWWALGALHYGWLMLDVAAQNGIPDADAETRRMVASAEWLRQQRQVPDAALCPLVQIPCRQQARRRAERLAGR